jgi:hypothetical protein
MRAVKEAPRSYPQKPVGSVPKTLPKKQGNSSKEFPHSVRQAASDLKKFRGNTTQLRDISHDSLQSELLKLF